MSDHKISYKVSIIMPTYNRADYILESIESIRNQTYKNWELIIIDDGSEDNTEDIVSELNDRKILFYKAGRIGVRSKIKNIGLSKASGELVAFIDSDDLWAPSKLEKQLSVLQEYPEAGFSLTNGYNFRKPGEPLEYFYKHKTGVICSNVFTGFFKSEIAAPVPTLMVKKECIAAVKGFNESQSLSDMRFILDLASQFKAVILYEPLFYRRLHANNYSSANWIKRQRQGIEMISSYKEQLPVDVFTQSLFKSYILFGEQYLQYDEREKAILQFLKAWKYKPFSIVPLKKVGKAILLKSKK